MKQTELSPDEFKKLLDERKVDFIFDLRNTDEFEAWRIEGRYGIETANIPQIEFVGEEEDHLGRFPKDKRIYTICAHGDSSRYSADLLRERGFDAVSLEGGMDAWSEFYEPRMVLHRANDHLSVYQIYRTAKGCISYLVASGGDAVVIDAPRHVRNVLDLASSLNVKIRHVMETHLQADHISGGIEIARTVGAPYYIHPVDAAGAPYDFIPFEDGLLLEFGKSRIEAIHSPGHTPGSTSLLLDEKFLFTGDTIMKTSVGRPDLGGMAEEWAALLFDTLFRRFERLADDTIVLPTHSASIRDQDSQGIVVTTMGDSRWERDLFRIRTLPEFTAFVKTSLLENPGRYQEIREVNLGLLSPDETRMKELEIGKNLCGMAGDKAQAAP